MHHPPFVTGVPAWDALGPVADRRALAETIERHPQVRRLAAGHVHRTITGVVAGRPAVVVPSTYVQVRLNFDSHEVELTAESAGFTLHAVVDGELIPTCSRCMGRDVARMDEPTIRPARLGDVAALSALAKRTWADAFGGSVDPDGAAAELDETRSEAYFAQALRDKTILVAEADRALLGYVQFGDVAIPEVDAQPGDRLGIRDRRDDNLHCRLRGDGGRGDAARSERCRPPIVNASLYRRLVAARRS